MASTKKAVKKAAGKVPWKGGSTPAKAAPVKKVAATQGPSPAMVARVEELFKLNAKTRKAAAVLAECKRLEDEAREDVVALFGKTKVDGMSHKLGRLSMVETKYLVVEDMKQVVAFAKKKGNTDILSVGVNTAAVKARLEAGVEVPGVKQDKRTDLRVTPAKSGK